MSEEKEVNEILESFKGGTKDHVLEIVKDDGLYKHLVYGEPGTNNLRVNIVTWPGYLNISGDMECYTFSRIEDMTKFFNKKRINPHYWGEKIQIPSSLGQDGEEYSSDLFKEWIYEQFSMCDSFKDKEQSIIACDEFLSSEDYGSEEYAMILIHNSDFDFIIGEDEEGNDIVLNINYDFFDFETPSWSKFTYHYIWTLEAIRVVCNLYCESKNE